MRTQKSYEASEEFWIEAFVGRVVIQRLEAYCYIQRSRLWHMELGPHARECNQQQEEDNDPRYIRKHLTFHRPSYVSPAPCINQRTHPANH